MKWTNFFKKYNLTILIQEKKQKTCKVTDLLRKLNSLSENLQRTKLQVPELDEHRLRHFRGK